MILKGAEAARYCAKPDPNRAGLLIFSADPGFRDTVASALASLDARLEWAADAGAALSALSVWPVRCVLVDLACAGDWPMLIAKLRRSPDLASTPTTPRPTSWTYWRTPPAVEITDEE